MGIIGAIGTAGVAAGESPPLGLAVLTPAAEGRAVARSRVRTMWKELRRIKVKDQFGRDQEIIYEGLEQVITTTEGTLRYYGQWRFRLPDGTPIHHVDPGRYRVAGGGIEFTGDPQNDPPPPPWPNKQ